MVVRISVLQRCEHIKQFEVCWSFQEPFRHILYAWHGISFVLLVLYSFHYDPLLIVAYR